NSSVIDKTSNLKYGLVLIPNVFFVAKVTFKPNPRTT
ncbi:MAG: hypothetical protein ACI9F1_002170, partial [Colwellia sp.]